MSDDDHPFDLIEQSRLLGGLVTALDNLRQATACMERAAGLLDTSCKAVALAMHGTATSIERKIAEAEDDSL